MELSTVAMRAAREISPAYMYHLLGHCSNPICSEFQLCDKCNKQHISILKQYADIIEKHMKEASLQTVTPLEQIAGLKVKIIPLIPEGEIWMSDKGFEPPEIPKDLIEKMKNLTKEKHND